MSDELDDEVLLQRVTPEMFREMVNVMKAVYGGGYINNKTTFEERKATRAKCYQVLKALGLEK